jgi:hypothetical protein
MKTPNRITPEQDRRYQELAAQGLALVQAIDRVQREFGLDEPHSRQAVSQRKYGFVRGKRGARPLTTEISPEDILAVMAEAIEARRELPGLKKELAECRREVARLKTELAAKENADRRMQELAQRIKKASA